MKITLYAIVPGDTREQVIDNAHRALLNLIPTPSGEYGGTNPVFDYYWLYADLAKNDEGRLPTPDDDGIYPTSDDETKEFMDNVFRSMAEEFQPLEDVEDGYPEPSTPAECRECIIYDEQGRPVISPDHYSSLIEQDDRWVVTAWFSW